ncbi:MAG: transcription elongation factor GreA [Deltaproteobacteria bacterium]|nr:transcription elongation factor GreA [Deltaproteobacteria bacterium]
MPVRTVPMTPEGHRKLKAELHRMEQVDWPDIVDEIEKARAHGDLKENAEYHAAKEKQGILDAKIRQIKHKLARAEIIAADELKGDTVAFGAHVKVKNMDTGDEQEYALVGPEETDVLSGKISIASPVGKALVGKGKGVVVEVQTPGGVRRLKILKIDW